MVSLYNSFSTTQAVSQPSTDSVSNNGSGHLITGGTGACVTPVSYWDIGVRGDTGPGNHSSTLTLAPTYSVLTDANDYSGTSLHNSGSNPTVANQYCNGSRTPPEFKSLGYQVPPGIADATVPNPIFNLTPAATVDEGNNWINMSWGPLAQTNPVSGSVLGNYVLATGSPAIDYIPTTGEGLPTGVTVPSTDFFNNPRPFPGTQIDVGAVEFQGAGGGGTGGGGTPGTVSVTPNPLRITVATPFFNAGSGTGTVTLSNTSTVASGSTVTITSVTVTSGSGSSPLAWFFNKEVTPGSDTCTGATLQPQQTCTVAVRFTNVTAGTGVDRSGTITFTDNATGSPQMGALIGHANP